MSGGKSMKKSVIGSRMTTMNSLNKMAPRPRKGRFIRRAIAMLPEASLGGLLRAVVSIFRGQRDEDVFERGTNDVDLCALDSNLAHLLFDVGAGDGIIHQQMHRLTKDGRAPHALDRAHSLQRLGDVIAADIKPARARRIDVGHLL